MSEMGDDFRVMRDKRKAVRLTLVACDLCGMKNAIDEPCCRCKPEEWDVWAKARKATA